jgi:hypothetical protein
VNQGNFYKFLSYTATQQGHELVNAAVLLLQGKENPAREGHLRRILAAYAGYYNELRTHLSLGKDAPHHRPIQRLGQLVAQPVHGGLHHQYCRT